MERDPESDEEEIERIVEKEKPEPRRGWEPDAETTEWISGKEAPSAGTPERQEIPKNSESLPEKEPDSGFGPIQDQPTDIQFAGDVQDVQKLREVVKRLESTGSGQALGNALRERGTRVHFGSLGENIIAETHWATNEITINEQLKDKPPSALAGYLAHEGTHVHNGHPPFICRDARARIQMPPNPIRSLESSERF